MVTSEISREDSASYAEPLWWRGGDLQDIVDKRGCQKSQELLQDPFPEKNCHFENSLQNPQPWNSHQHCLEY